MRNLSKLGLSLLLVFLLSLLCLTVTLLILLRHRRRQLRQPLAGDSETGRKGASFSCLCCSIQSRVEPAGGSPEICASGCRQVKIPAVEEECDLAAWREMAIGRSRVLYTIKEEEEREEEDFFETPCESPEFYTPVSSPARATAAGEGALYFSVIG